MEGEQLARELASLHAQSWGWALACCGRDASAAADVLQQAYWKVLEGRARFGGTASLRTWFFSVIRLTAMEQRRTIVRWLRRASPAEREAGDIPASSSKKPDRTAERGEAAERLARALATLAPRQREVLHLVFYEELTIADAAAIMDVSVGSARQHYERGKKNLKERLADDLRTS